jgi:hypothetical protein
MRSIITSMLEHNKTYQHTIHPPWRGNERGDEAPLHHRHIIEPVIELRARRHTNIEPMGSSDMPAGGARAKGKE